MVLAARVIVLAARVIVLAARVIDLVVLGHRSGRSGTSIWSWREVNLVVEGGQSGRGERILVELVELVELSVPAALVCDSWIPNTLFSKICCS